MPFGSSRSLLLFLASFVYLAVPAFLVSRGVRHFELFSLAAQLGVLLPAVWFALQPPGGGVVSRWRNKPSRRWLLVLLFVMVCLGFSYYIGPGSCADEAAYKFQAEVFASFHMKAAAPPGSTAVALDVPLALAFKHFILSNTGWFTKYPMGWPLILAIGERFNAGWAVAPILGGVLLLVIALIAKEAFGGDAMLPAVWLAVLSPYVLSESTGRMSHALCGLLVALATLFYLRGIRTNRLSQFALMFATLAASYHVRSFTTFLVTGVLVSGLLLHYRSNLRMLVRVLPIAVLAGVISVGSVLAYNHFYTGHWLMSPYELYEPAVFKTTAREIVKNVLEARRYSIQSTLLFTFPFVFLLAGYGYWINRHSPAVKILALIFPAIVLAHLFWIYTGTPIVGERFFYEGYFSVVILAAGGLQALLATWNTPRVALLQAAAALTLLQIGMTVVGGNEMTRHYRPYLDVQKLAAEEQDCHCAVFLKSTEDLYIFDGSYLNMNTPAWRSANVFYLNDPGPNERSYWAALFGWRDWVVLSFDVQKQRAVSESYRSLPVVARQSWRR